MNLGDALAANFQSKAILIRVTYGMWLTIVWAIFAIAVASWRIVLVVYVLQSLNAPRWMWVSFVLLLPFSFLIDQFETKAARKKEAGG